ncbi:hypothetical protein EDD16DRAFT_990693 [Pisolithus croceorrhizus]|nr:hypothetical protein EV401DRAFT_86707 [Pisolithus croceorrhizus]KAI6117827.1 hypothetical protein EDD16DRAFT_990693 [Pisolithus croceorrhizus]
MSVFLSVATRVHIRLSLTVLVSPPESPSPCLRVAVSTPRISSLPTPSPRPSRPRSCHNRRGIPRCRKYRRESCCWSLVGMKMKRVGFGFLGVTAYCPPHLPIRTRLSAQSDNADVRWYAGDVQVALGLLVVRANFLFSFIVNFSYLTSFQTRYRSYTFHRFNLRYYLVSL